MDKKRTAAMQVNKSIDQLNKEIETAKREALKSTEKKPNQIGIKKHERSDMVKLTSEGVANTLIDQVLSKRVGQRSGVQKIPRDVKVKIEQIFAKHDHQYSLLGLYYGAGFTRTEIADILGLQRQNVGASLRSAVARLKKYLTPEEYDSIRWALGDYKPLQGTQPSIDHSKPYRGVHESDYQHLKYYTPYTHFHTGEIS
ncbi:sigma-70 family RNA polymerase sigma factor [Paenibacillus sp. BC26]|uniref:sigma-70 family RNA polymerase sigma factor n=1 Tax=Paenibacillus sp. BC26 TaxID=1881032 RepID=UPI0008E0F0D9|nr:sigma-70 family RNA polymerase sigma factor [Paenibacillus sp. BC26]SFS70076.1 hypothetical protein SAMN05428962_2364 [Paenibacillus sp. BC26]